MPLFFTPTEAKKLLPQIQKALLEIMELKSKAEKNNEEELAGGMKELQERIEKLQELGCILKDLHLGLVDFPAVRLGKRVYLCWKIGEADIKFWHGLDEGFAGRKPVKQEEFYDEDMAIRSLA